MGVRVYDPAKPRDIVPDGYLIMYKDTTTYIHTYPKTVGGLLTQILKRWEGRKLEGGAIIDVWGGFIQESQGVTYVFTIGRYNTDINGTNVVKRLPERQLFYKKDNFCGICSVGYWCGSISLIGNVYSGGVDGIYRRHRHCNTNDGEKKFYHYLFRDLPYLGSKLEYGNIQYMNPWGMWEFYPAFVIGKQWRRRKTDRPLELLERVTSESDELVLTVGIPTIALSRNPNNPRDARYVAEMLRSYVVYWAFNDKADQWVRVAILNKEAKVDFHKAYFTVQLVLIRDFIYEDNRVIYNQENGTA